MHTMPSQNVNEAYKDTPSVIFLSVRDLHQRKIAKPSWARMEKSSAIQCTSRNITFPDNTDTLKDPETWRNTRLPLSYQDEVNTLFINTRRSRVDLDSQKRVTNYIRIGSYRTGTCGNDFPGELCAQNSGDMTFLTLYNFFYTISYGSYTPAWERGRGLEIAEERKMPTG